MDHSGLTISTSNAQTNLNFKGQNYGYRPYFLQAQEGQLGEFYGIGATTGKPGYFYAISARDQATNASGVIAIKIDLSTLQQTWQASGVQIVLANEDGVALLASTPEWRYRTLTPLTDKQRDRIVTSRQFADEQLQAFEWDIDAEAQTARVDGDHMLYLRTSDLPNSWSLHLFLPTDAVLTRTWLTTAAFLTLMMLGFITYQQRRARAMVVALKRSEQEESLLRASNDRLAVEVQERRNAQQSLRKTQTELERAGRLAALGQLASSVTHELGQPITAMRNQLAAAEMTTGASPLTERMEGLVARMEGITRQLKFFSRKGRDRFEVIDIRDVMDDALGLLEPTITESEANVMFNRPSNAMMVKANRLRIEQVMTNVIRNALDAVEESETRDVIIEMGTQDTRICFSVTDTGHGLGGKTFDDLNEPFATTRESGRGMGLGLTISAGIVSDHAGTIAATDQPLGGAVFRINLPQYERNT
ncbi:MAG: ATP-binding protein [Planktomarina sp.]